MFNPLACGTEIKISKYNLTFLLVLYLDLRIFQSKVFNTVNSTEPLKSLK